MIKTTTWLIVIVLCVLTHGRLNAQEIDLSQPLNLEECIKIALEKSTDIKNANLDLALDELRIKDARSNYFPSINVGGRYNFSDKVDIGFEEENYSATITGRYLLWDHGQSRVNLDQSRIDKDATLFRYEQTKQRLIFNLIQSYYNLLESQKLVEVDKMLLEQSKENTEKVRAFREVGRLNEADVAAAEVREANDELSLINDQNALEVAMADLVTLMGLDPGTVIKIVDDPDHETYVKSGWVELEKITLEKAIQNSLTNRPEFRESDANIKSLESELKLTKLQRWPQLSAEYSYDSKIDEYLRDRENNKFGSWGVLAALTFPLFDGGVAKRRVERLDMTLEKTKGNAVDLERNIALEVRQSYLNLKRAEKSLEISSKQVRNAKLSLDVTNGRFEEEKAIPLELLEAQAAYAQALTNRVRAFYDYKIAKSSLQRAIGELKE